jgi:hypothetical protein
MSTIRLYEKKTNQLLGEITEAELEFLIDRLEETSDEDQDYFIDEATVDYLADGEATDHLIELLKKAVGSSEGIEIRWQRH